jgi:sodium-dependent dicarboxylate transporter 2/3/5
MSVTAFLSMWLSNTATTAMMMPIAQAVINEIHDSMKANARAAEEDELNSPLNEKGGESLQMKANGETASKKDGSLDGDPEEAAAESILIENNHGRRKFVRKDSESVEPKDFVRRDSVCSRTLKEIKAEKAYKKFAVGLKLSIALAANIGGTGTLTGTGPNLVIKGQLDTIYGPDNDVNFTTWFVFAFPNMCISLIVGWAWLVMLYISPKDLIMCCKQKGDPGAASAIKTEYEKLGPMSFAEGAVLIHFIVLALAWFSRDPQVFPGWSELLVESGYVTDACVGMTIAMSLFFCPCRPPMFMRCPAVSTCCKSDGYEDETDDGMYKPVPALLDWEDVHKHMAWGVIMILGGSFALADACSASGLSAYMGMILGNWEGVPLWALVIVLCFITTVFTNIISNTATATIFLPILAEMANGMHVNPLYLMIPVAIAASFAFMLPVATPPNAIVFAYGGVRIIDMVISGTLMNIICILLLQVSLNTYGIPLFNLNEFPEWASRGQIQELAINATTPSAFSYNVTLGN